MSKKDEQQSSTEVHHALLFAWIGKAVVEQAGEQTGEAVLRTAIRQYGEERGRRMALRAQANRHPLTMANYFAYGEYEISPGEMDLKITRRSPHARLCISKCPWHTAWREDGLLALGRLYCLEIDQALVRGFNPALQLDVKATRTSGAAECEFIYHDADPTLPNLLLLRYRKAVRPGAKAVMGWDYHVGHLFTTLEKIIVQELGEEGQRAIEAGLVEFAERYGAQAAQRVAASRSKDYTSVSEE